MLNSGDPIGLPNITLIDSGGSLPTDDCLIRGSGCRVLLWFQQYRLDGLKLGKKEETSKKGVLDKCK